MSVRSGQSITVDFTTSRFDTGNVTAADSLPTGTLVINGTDDAATVTVTSKTGGKYKASVTLPTLAVGDVVQLRIAATVNSISGIGIIWTDQKDIAIDSNGKAPATIAAGDIATDAITAASMKADAVTKIQAGLSTYAGGAVSSVTGNVGGNVVGSVGSVVASVTAGTVSDKTGYSLSSAGVQAIWDAVTSALTTVGSIGKWIVDKLDVVLSTRGTSTYAGADTSGTTTLLSRLTSSRAGYLDNISAGAVALESSVTSIQNNTRSSTTVPEVIERPDSGTTTYRIELFLYDEIGNMEAPDSAPTIALVNQSGTDLSSRLDSATMTLVSTGRYRAIYTASVGDTLEQLVWVFSVTEGGATRLIGRTSVIVDTTAADFTSTDRTKLTAVYDKLPTNNIADETLVLAAVAGVQSDTDDIQSKIGTPSVSLAADIGSRLATSGYTAPDNTTIGTINTKLGTPAASVSADIAAVNAKTTNLPSDPADQSAVEAAIATRASQTSVDAIAAGTGVLVAATGAVADLAATTTSFKTNLTAANDTYNDQLLVFTSGSLAKQARPILDFANTNGVVSFDEGFTASPSSGDQFAILVNHIHPVSQIQSGLATQSSVDSLPSTSDIIDAMTGDSITPAKANEMLIAFMSGKVSASSSGGITTYTFKRRDGTTTSFTSACSESDGTRVSTGTIP